MLQRDSFPRFGNIIKTKSPENYRVMNTVDVDAEGRQSVLAKAKPYFEPSLECAPPRKNVPYSKRNRPNLTRP